MSKSQRPTEHIFLDVRGLELGVSREQMFAFNNFRWWRRVDEHTISMVIDSDEHGPFTQLVVTCPDCGQVVSSPPLRCGADVKRLMDSDLTDHHRCTAMERN